MNNNYNVKGPLVSLLNFTLFQDKNSLELMWLCFDVIKVLRGGFKPILMTEPINIYFTNLQNHQNSIFESTTMYIIVAR